MEGGSLLFNVVFFVVLVSAVTQGWSLPLVARWLKLGKTSDPVSPVTLEINALRHVDGEIVEYVVTPTSKVAGQVLRDLALPYNVLVALVVRRDNVIIPRGSTSLEPGDHVFIAMRTRLKPLLTCLFDACPVIPPFRPGCSSTSAPTARLRNCIGFLACRNRPAQGTSPSAHCCRLVRMTTAEGWVRLSSRRATRLAK